MIRHRYLIQTISILISKFNMFLTWIKNKTICKIWEMVSGIMQKHNLDIRRIKAGEWIINAQKATPDGGVSAYYDLETGYYPSSYPEVTGYIIPTLFDLYKETGVIKFRKAALKMAEWLIQIQFEDGGYPTHDFKTLYVFDTGQVISGLLRCYYETEDRRYIKAAIRAGYWILRYQKKTGAYMQTTSKNYSHTYHARVAWILLQLYAETGIKAFKHSAIKNLEWCINVIKDNMWPSPEKIDITHFIAYAIRGILESGILLRNRILTDKAIKITDKIINLVGSDGYLPGELDSEWKTRANYTNLTGNLQLSIIMLIIYRLTNRRKYLNSAIKLINYVIHKQDINNSNKGICGGISGSHPIEGRYMPYKYLSWSTKFYIDSLNLLLNKELRLTG